MKKGVIKMKDYSNKPYKNHRPDHLWQLALYIADRKFDQQHIPVMYLDTALPYALSYCQVKAMGGDLTKHPNRTLRFIEEAEAIYCDDSAYSIRWVIEALLCTDIMQDKIAEFLQIPINIVFAYEHLFFNVRVFKLDRISFDRHVLAHTSDTIYDRDAKIIAHVHGMEIYKLIYFDGPRTEEEQKKLNIVLNQIV
jgi:hypothetical protein